MTPIDRDVPAEAPAETGADAQTWSQQRYRPGFNDLIREREALRGRVAEAVPARREPG